MESGQTRPPGTILLVENEYALRELMRRFLEGSGYAVLNARDGDEALSVATAHATPIDLLLTDVVMPGMSGFALASRVAELHRETKVLYISGYADDYDGIKQGLTESGQPLLLKPFSQAELFRKVDEVLSATGPVFPVRN
ncbi:MAG TPA: response regulator [Vicinamibacterales bacterium]|nr:response regulator [Vicinamibacterales bacterium]